MEPSDVFYVVYTPTPNSSHTDTPPDGFRFGGKSFSLEAYLNGTKLDNPTFGEPILLTLVYEGAELNDLSPALLELYAWDESAGAWSTDGITVVNRDLGNNTITFAIAHLTEFAYFGPIYQSSVYLSVLLQNAKPADVTPDDLKQRKFFPYLAR